MFIRMRHASEVYLHVGDHVLVASIRGYEDDLDTSIRHFLYTMQVLFPMSLYTNFMFTYILYFLFIYIYVAVRLNL